MGVDAEILFRTTDGEEPKYDYMPPGFEPEDIPPWLKEDNPEATHHINTMSRYYGEGYERGRWPEILSAILNLMSATNVDRVWYGGDSDECFSQELTVERINELNEHYIKHGRRPYFGR